MRFRGSIGHGGTHAENSPEHGTERDKKGQNRVMTRNQHIDQEDVCPQSNDLGQQVVCSDQRYFFADALQVDLDLAFQTEGRGSRFLSAIAN